MNDSELFVETEGRESGAMPHQLSIVEEKTYH